MRLRLCENLRAYAYAPFYFALSHGTFAAEQLEIEHVCSPAMSSTATMLLDGAADVNGDRRSVLPPPPGNNPTTLERACTPSPWCRSPTGSGQEI